MSINVDAAASRKLSPSGGETTVEVTIDPIAKTKPTTRHVVLLIDTSASMLGRKIDNAKSGARRALRALDPDDYVSIVGFDSEIEVVQQIVQWKEADQKAARKAVDAIQAGGGTDIYKGLETARDQLVERAPDQGRAVDRIILLSDGQDRYSPSTYRKLASEFDEDGISIMAAGIGTEYDEAVMLALANASGGTPADLSEEDIGEFLGETVSETEDVLAPDPILRIEPGEGFVVKDEPAYFDSPLIEQRHISARNDHAELELSELQVDKVQRLSFEMLGQPRSAGLVHELAELTVVDATDTALARTTVEIEYTQDGAIARVDIEKKRAAANVTTDIQDPNVADREVTAAIEEIENRGWTDTAEDLEQRLDKSEEVGGIIRLSKSDLDRTD